MDASHDERRHRGEDAHGPDAPSSAAKYVWTDRVRRRAANVEKRAKVLLRPMRRYVPRTCL